MRKILIADDDPIIIKVLNAGLSKAGYEVSAALDGQQAVDLTQKILPDLIILDATMPKLDGFSVLRKLKGDPATATIPVLFLTARPTAGDMLAAQSLGAEAYLSKPVDMPALIARIKALEGSRAAS